MTENESTNQDRNDGEAAACPVTGISRAFDPFAADPYEVYAKARKEAPVFHSPEIGYYVLTRDGDVREAMMNADNFSASVALELYKPLAPEAARIIEEHGVQISPSVVDEEAPEHGPHKKATRQAGLAPSDVRAMEPLIRELVTKQIDSFVKRGEADLVADFMFDVPALVIFKLFAVPDEDIETVRSFAKRNAEFGFGLPTEEQQVELANSMAEYWEYAKSHVDRLLKNPGDDFISRFIANTKEQDVYEREYVSVIMLQLLFAGHETTTNAAAGSYRALLQHRDQWEAVCEDPELVEGAVEESLRFAPSVPQWGRVTTQPVTLSGVDLPEGTKLLVALGSANRDEERFENGETFDIRRDNAKEHVAFGHGRHLCAGAPLARLELNIALEELTRRLPHIELVEGQEFPFSPNTSHRGPENVFVTWDPAKNPVPEDRP